MCNKFYKLQSFQPGIAGQEHDVFEAEINLFCIVLSANHILIKKECTKLFPIHMSEIYCNDSTVLNYNILYYTIIY